MVVRGETETERLRVQVAEQEAEIDRLRHRLALTQAILQETPAIVYAKDQERRFSLSNRRHAELIGLPEERILGRTDTDLFGAEAAAIEEVSQEVMATGTPKVSEFDLSLQGELRTFHETIFPIREGDGTVVGVGGIATDMTELRRQQRNVEKARATFEIMMRDSPVALVLVQADGVVVMANGAARGLFDDELLVGRKIDTLVRGVSGPGLLHCLRSASQEAAASEGHAPVDVRPRRGVDVTLCLAKGALKPAELRASLLELPEQPAVLLSLVDITLRKEAEDAMRRAREHAEAAAKAKGSFLAHMSHEIRSPLNAVLGYAQLLARDTSLTPKQSGRVERILRAGDHLLSLVNQVLDMSVIESGHLDVVLGPVEPKALVDEVVEMFEPRAAKAGIRLSRNVAKEVPSTVLADAGKVRQILINVVGNAVRVTTNGGVDVEVVLDKHTDRGPSSEARRLVFRVHDSGPGISPEDAERIFSPFEQGGPSTARGSAGLGLAISRRYADLMGGSLSFTPRSSGGTTFELVLPLEEPRATAQEAVLPRGEEATLGPSDGTPSRKPSVVLIDDEEDNCDVLRETLENEGFLVATAASGEEGLSLVRHVHPDAVVVDQRMPGMDGLTTVERMRSDTPPFQGPILMLSASIFEGLDQQAIQAGANAYMAKPVQQSELVQRVRDLLRSKVSEERPGVEA